MATSPSEIRVNELKAEHLELEIASMKRMTAESVAASTHTGQFHFIGPVHETSAHQMIQKIDSFVRRYPGQPIEILLNSGGGAVWDGFALIDYIERIKAKGTHVTIVGLGVCASMAGILMQCASDRVMTKHAWFHMHELSSMVAGSVSSQEDNLKLAKAMQGQAMEMLCARSTLTPAKLRNLWQRKESYLDAQTALKLGLIDRIEA